MFYKYGHNYFHSNLSRFVLTPAYAVVRLIANGIARCSDKCDYTRPALFIPTTAPVNVRKDSKDFRLQDITHERDRTNNYYYIKHALAEQCRLHHIVDQTEIYNIFSCPSGHACNYREIGQSNQY